MQTGMGRTDRGVFKRSGYYFRPNQRQWVFIEAGTTFQKGVNPRLNAFVMRVTSGPLAEWSPVPVCVLSDHQYFREKRGVELAMQEEILAIANELKEHGIVAAEEVAYVFAERHGMLKQRQVGKVKTYSPKLLDLVGDVLETYW